MTQKPLMPLNRVGEVLRAALEEIVARDGSAPANEVLAGVEKRVHLTDVERAPTRVAYLGGKRTFAFTPQVA